MNRRLMLLLAVGGAFAIAAVASALGAGVVGSILSVVWVLGWAYRFWELR